MHKNKLATKPVRNAKPDKTPTVFVGGDVGEDVALVGQKGINALAIDPPPLPHMHPVCLRKGTRWQKGLTAEKL